MPNEAFIYDAIRTPRSSGKPSGSLAGVKPHKLLAGLLPQARILSVAALATEPTIMLLGPSPAAKLCLSKAGLSVADIDLWEINEAFAVVPMKFMQDMGVAAEITNVNGGAIAMGHPLGATGAMLLGILLDELERTHKKRGCVALCAAGGMGVATIIERL